MRYYLTIVLLTLAIITNAQVQGTVYEAPVAGDTIPLVGANVYLPGENTGTITNNQGRFELNVKLRKNQKIVVSYVGYITDTIVLGAQQTKVNVYLRNNTQLDEILVSEREAGTYISLLKPIKVEQITRSGLEQLACCNLSESFENNATVDVSFSDAVSGAKQIKMLGLAGTNVQMLSENIPELRGLSSAFGLTFTPGWWLESIQVSKGAAAVTNGYESITGQINYELKKPDEDKLIDANVYANNEGRIELNLINNIQLSDKLSTNLMFHTAIHEHEFDHNNDNFIDVPTGNIFNVLNRWSYKTEHMHYQLMFNYLQDNKKGGQMSGTEVPKGKSLYKTAVNNEKVRVTQKLGYGFHRSATSIGWQTYYEQFNLGARFGQNNYQGKQKSLYSNLIFNTYIGNTSHQLTSGASIIYEKYNNTFKATNYNRNEIVPGLFSQYTWFVSSKLTSIIGLRLDKHNIHGWLLTPRLHARYAASDDITLRASVGKGYRSANVFTENIRFMPSNRKWNIEDKFKMNEAWNAGINTTYKFNYINNRQATVTLDYYYTTFSNNVYADVFSDPGEVNVYNLVNGSYSHSFQTDLMLEINNNIDVTSAIRVNDVQRKIDGTFKQELFTSKVKGLLTFSYATRYNKWQYNITSIFNGKPSVPSIAYLPQKLAGQYSEPKSFVTLHTQLTRKFKHFEVYVGGENLLNIKQKSPIISPQDPNNEFFDASLIWGPVSGRMIYAGLRYQLIQKR